jgi:hypothetical protein
VSANPKKAVIQESGKCIGWVCMACVRLHTTAIYLAKDEAAEAAALDAATRCCVTPLCACGAEAKVYAKLCSNCWRAEQDAKDQARWDAASKKTIAEYLTEHPDGFLSDGDEKFWPVSDYIDDEVYLRHPRVWFCKPQRGIKLDADEITESWADERHEDARDDLDLKGLQELLDKWCAEQVTTSWYVTGVALAPSEVEHLCREAAASDGAAASAEPTETP